MTTKNENAEREPQSITSGDVADLGTVVSQSDEQVHLASREAVLAQLPALIAAVPDAEDDDGSGIIAAVLMSADPLNAGAGEGLPEAEDMLDKILTIEKLSKRETTVADSWTPYYFIVEGVQGPRRDPFVFGTSSQTIMAQLATMYSLGQLPAKCKVHRPSKATRGGFFPLSLRPATAQ